MYPIDDDQQFVLELLEAEKVLVVQGTGFNWPQPDHLRLVFLPNSDDLAEAIGRIARFLDGYRRRNGDAMKPINVGLLGFGTVGRGTWDVLRRNEQEIQRRAGRPIAINWIATRTLDRARDGHARRRPA